MPGGWELIVIVLVVVLLFGSKKLPELARSIGKAGKAFKEETHDLRADKDTPTPPQQAAVQANVPPPAVSPVQQPTTPTAQTKPDTVA